MMTLAIVRQMKNKTTLGYNCSSLLLAKMKPLLTCGVGQSEGQQAILFTVVGM